MTQKPKHSIPNPCSKNWNDMLASGTNEFKNCQSCNEKVFDIRNLNTNEIENLYYKQDKRICVIAKENQLIGNNSTAFEKIKKIGIASLLISGSLVAPSLYAQNKANTYKIEQVENLSQSITIEGKVKIKSFLGWKNVNEFFLNIYSNNTLIKEIIVDRRDPFKVTLNKKELGENISLSFHAEGYKNIKIENLEAKDIQFRVFLDKKKVITRVGFFQP